MDTASLDRAFLTWQARMAGASRRLVDDPRLARPFHGIRAPAVDIPDDEHPHATAVRRILAAAAAYRVRMSSLEFFSHTTAALLWGLPLPHPGSADIHVSVLAPGHAARARGVAGHQLKPDAVTLTTMSDGTPVTDPASTWALLGVLLHHPYDLVAVADACLYVDRIAGPHSRIVAPALASMAELTDAVERAPKRRGVVALRDALPRVREGAASRPETWTRLTLVDGGLPEPTLNLDVYDGEGFIACVDIAYPRERVAIEYEGDQHRTDARQWQRDIERQERLAAAGWRTVRVTRDALFRHPGTVVARVRGALAAR
ncbi:MAG: DUF559 domain-containing protein [Microbacterium sp.]|uniref:endonuclease domain-containing protein n=1 Tax=Microbacterium sp. TaxID=51671 RepID=UPI0039E59596